MAKGLRVKHVCECGATRIISKIVMARRNGTRCQACGRNMQPTEAGWETIGIAQARKVGQREKYVDYNYSEKTRNDIT